MIAIDEDKTTLHITKGNATHDTYNRLAVRFPIYNFGTEEIDYYEFQLTDKLTLTVYEKKGYTKNEILKKEYTISSLGYESPTTMPELVLDTDDTNVFELLNKPKTYWYDIVLNDDTTIIGYDENGGKKFIVYPETIESEE